MGITRGDIAKLMREYALENFKFATINDQELFIEYLMAAFEMSQVSGLSITENDYSIFVNEIFNLWKNFSSDDNISKSLGNVTLSAGFNEVYANDYHDCDFTTVDEDECIMIDEMVKSITADKGECRYFKSVIDNKYHYIFDKEIFNVYSLRDKIIKDAYINADLLKIYLIYQ